MFKSGGSGHIGKWNFLPPVRKFERFCFSYGILFWCCLVRPGCCWTCSYFPWGGEETGNLVAWGILQVWVTETEKSDSVTVQFNFILKHDMSSMYHVKTSNVLCCESTYQTNWGAYCACEGITQLCPVAVAPLWPHLVPSKKYNLMYLSHWEPLCQGSADLHHFVYYLYANKMSCLKLIFLSCEENAILFKF